jgi:hypothetical protein
LLIHEELTGTVEPEKMWTFDLRQQGFGSSDLGRKEESYSSKFAKGKVS